MEKTLYHSARLPLPVIQETSTGVRKPGIWGAEVREEYCDGNAEDKSRLFADKNDSNGSIFKTYTLKNYFLLNAQCFIHP